MTMLRIVDAIDERKDCDDIVNDDYNDAINVDDIYKQIDYVDTVEPMV